MFKLQRLEITGFKSFADYTEILFTGDGITAVVGPNGCGKSNVSDCISWVLGEQRAKSLRGEDMKDVIFQGTNKRKPSGMAEVVLHLIRDEIVFNDEDDLSDIDESIAELDEHAVDASEFEEVETVTAETAGVGAAVAPAKIKPKRHWRPRNRAFDFAVGEAVSVTRRLYLSGESEYLLNGKSCRLRDIHDLFSGTGLSGSNYAIIEQGKIGQILSSKPSDRRTLIEEAAGISKFRTRQRAAESRLESAKGNLRRISDIVSEVEKQENALRRQAAKTRRYKVLREEFRELLRQVFVAEGNRLSNLVDELETKLSGASDEERKLSAEVLQKDEAFRKATQIAREAEEKLAELRAIHAENALKRDRVQREIVYQNEQTHNLTKRSDVLKFDTSSNEQRLKLISDEAVRLKKEDSEHSQVVAKEELDLREAEHKYQSKQQEVREIEADLEKIRNEVLQHTTASERFAEIKRQLENNSERLNERLEGLHRESTRAVQTHTEHLAEVQQIQQDIAAAKLKLEKNLTQKRKFSDAANEVRQTLQTVESGLKKHRDEFSRTKHRLETLRELEEKKAIYAPSVQKLFAAQTQIGVQFTGTLADKLSVETKVEKAVEAIFGNSLQAVLVANSADGFKVSKWISENNVGRITVISEKGKGRKFKISGESLIAHLGVSGDFIEVLIDLFPREMLAKVVENIEDIPASSTEDFVTFNGDLYLGGMLFTSGKQISNEKNSSLLAFKRELRDLEISNKNLSNIVEKSEKEVAKIRQLLTEKESQTADLQQVITKQERELYSKEVQAKSLSQETERAERHKRVVEQETNQIEREISELVTKQFEVHDNAKKAETARLTASTQFAEISEKLQISRQNTERESAILSEKRAASAASIERRRSVSSSLRRVESEQREIESRLANQRLEIIEIEANLANLDQSIQQLKIKHESVDEEKTIEANELSEATEHLNNSRQQADEFSAELTELNKLSGDTRNKRAEIEVGQAEAVTRLQNLNESCSNELNLSLVELLGTAETDAEFNLSEGKMRIEDLREKLDNFGAINMLALEELSEAEERLLFLTSQRRDIVDSIGLAEEALREIKERSRERFKDAFEAINKHFSVFFSELFGGGKGEMSLLEAEDILEAGIEIVAQPPGKRLQNLLLLSGGEKAMTAIALVMAIFQYRPSPFCLLDEVDAPLDEANVGRFVAKIEQMSANTQFIVITHNKRTMEAAKALYGVTMQEAGVSKVVSVRFE
jgi:chromosome segregation protein